MNTLDPDQLKTLIGLTAARLKDVTEALEKNWAIQLVCAAVGIALVYDIADLPRIVCKYFGQESCTLRSAAPIFVVVVLYYFMKFGHLLTAFVEVRELHDSLLNTYLENVQRGALKPIQESTSFFEGYYSASAFSSGWVPLRLAYFFVSLSVIVIGQSSALFLLVRAYEGNAMALTIAGLAGAALLILYGGFWQSKKGHLHTTKIVVTCLVLLPISFAIFVITTCTRG